jgi:UDP-N-acetyl-D-galactosamine dehydrogenase
MGITFKEDVSDIRNSKVADVVNEFKSFGVKVDVVDAFASAHEVEEEYGLQIQEKPSGKYDAVVVAVQHHQYRNMKESEFKALLSDKGIFVDLKGIFRNSVKDLKYWSL